ncbi:MAG TPA: hypothetical protein DHU69_02565 [Deltaproteobacteria bacterium]|nr:hypothetical protein [Deltaproteobacteria bacterium]HCY18649.1 hypothetical protein [Deltaproteobacteria bacterium]
MLAYKGMLGFKEKSMQRYEKEDAWLALLGQQESSRLEFKSARIFEKKEKAVHELSQETSAFANSEGGVILIGMEERKEGKTRVADKIMGIDQNEIPPEWLQQVLESNLSPFLPGIRVFPVCFSGHNSGKVGYSILIPQGTTAYQANDMKYYGRSEYEKKALPDHEIRLRMMKGRITQASVVIGESQYITSKEHNETLRRRKKKAIDSGRIWRSDEKEIDHDTCLIKLEVYNTSDVTIADFILELRLKSPFSTQRENRRRFRFVEHTEIIKGDLREKAMSREVIFPRDRVPFPNETLELRIPAGQDFFSHESYLTWTVFLDNAPPCRGEFDLREVLKQELNKAE